MLPRGAAAGDCQSLESETDGEMGDGGVGQDLILESRVVTVQGLNSVMNLCCLSDRMREKGNNQISRGEMGAAEQASSSSVPELICCCKLTFFIFDGKKSLIEIGASVLAAASGL